MQPQSGKGNMKLDIKHTLAIAAASSFALASYAIAAPHGAGNMSPGNSSFGRSQGANPAMGSTNSAFGRNTAEDARLNSHRNSEEVRDADNDNDNGKIKKTKHAKNHTARGNSAFG